MVPSPYPVRPVVTSDIQSLGIIAGSRELPLLIAREARRQGVPRIVAVAFRDETSPEIESGADEVEWLRVGQLAKLIKAFSSRDVRHCVMAGQIAPKNLFEFRPDLKTAAMIQRGTEQGFAEQTAATEALRGRVADIDNYNVKGTTNVYFDTGKYALSGQAQAQLCGAAAQADQMDNALLLVVGYTDSTGSYEINQELSEKRAERVVNYLQQQCGWKPYRMLTPTGMAQADPVADNSTDYGKQQNRRVAVNILVSKAVDGM